MDTGNRNYLNDTRPILHIVLLVLSAIVAGAAALSLTTVSAHVLIAWALVLLALGLIF